MPQAGGGRRGLHSKPPPPLGSLYGSASAGQRDELLVLSAQPASAAPTTRNWQFGFAAC